MSRAHIIAFANQKGGCGKTTSCQNVGWILSQKDYKVLCIDVDGQAHLSVSYGIRCPESLEHNFTTLVDQWIVKNEVSQQEVKDAIIHMDSIDLLPATFRLDMLERELVANTNREYVLADIIEQVQDDYDYILLDCNSSPNLFTINALACADELIIPCQAQFLSLGGIDLILSMVRQMKKRINPRLQVGGILLTMYQANTNQSRITATEIREKYGQMVYETMIPTSVKVPESQKLGRSVCDWKQDNSVSHAYVEFVESEVFENER